MAAVYLYILKSELPLRGKSLTPTIADDARNPTNGRIHVRGIYLEFCTYGNPPFAVGNVFSRLANGTLEKCNNKKDGHKLIKDLIDV